eukprot:754391-Hanusia_phi.AAC.2
MQSRLCLTEHSKMSADGGYAAAAAAASSISLLPGLLPNVKNNSYGIPMLSGRQSSSRGHTFRSNFLEINCAGHGESVLRSMRDFQNNKEMCDVSVVVGSQEFLAHKLVLAASSEYFRTKFLSSRPDKCRGTSSKALEKIVLDFDFILPELFSPILDTMYTGVIRIQEQSLLSTIRLASEMGMGSLKQRLVQHVCNTVNAANANEVKTLGAELDCAELVDAAKAVGRAKEEMNSFCLHLFSCPPLHTSSLPSLRFSSRYLPFVTVSDAGDGK